MVMSCDDITKPELAKMKAVKLAVCVVIAFACLVDCTRGTCPNTATATGDRDRKNVHHTNMRQRHSAIRSQQATFLLSIVS
uniref:Uncharacterized protein n=2 Tax=Timema TaxID=61471 RepID=A0A7R9CKY7_TIMPO|nr:unnamed protein product [Timema douglasi]CAD7398475.1 unnamed protein product [Timema poppensis]